ncbi:AraC family transcriptional regulator [Paenibacillus sambharensis]|uniref:AraC family transcriptional regulator n=1 Tax=Paenibacillus sambharensis TaxID=1803190 RepID=A0A2W1L2P7_9BACL|nr:AraC family transcriptional regulator [Paenibacillus sambharensis]PZD93616.1 AraC family transcriptional regulator [Paenibacillus sambharensis]
MPNTVLSSREAGFAWHNAMFRLTEADVFRGEGGTLLAQQLTSQFVLIFVSRGVGKLVLDNAEIRLEPGGGYLCPPGRTYGLQATMTDGMDVNLLQFDVMVPCEEGNSWRPARAEDVRAAGQEFSFLLRDAGEMIIACDTVIRLIHSQDPLDCFQAQISFQEILHLAVRSSRQQSENLVMSLWEVKQYMDEHFQQNLSIEHLAKLAGVSPKYFVDLFKKTFGLSALDYLTEVRISKAKRYLLHSGAKLRDIARQVGYQDEFYFSRKFKQSAGMSPTAFIRSRSRRVAAYGTGSTGYLIALQVVPYAAPMHPKWTAYYYEHYRDAVPVHLSAFRVNEHWELNILRLAEAAPELILCLDNQSAHELNKLKDTGGEVFMLDTSLSWREQLGQTAEWLDVSQEASQWLARYDRLVLQARRQLKPAADSEKVLVIRLRKQRMYAYCNRSMAEVLYGDLGVQPAYHVSEAQYDIELSMNELLLINPDRILLNICRESETLALWKQRKQSAEWQALSAAAAGRVHIIHTDPWGEYSPAAHERMIKAYLLILTGNRT